MKLNNIGMKIWVITIGLTLIAFLSTTFFYGHFYRQQVETSYLNDFNEIILNVENLSETNPTILTETLNQYNTLNSRIYFSVETSEENETVTEGISEITAIQFPPYIQQKLRKEPRVIEAVRKGEDTQIQATAYAEEKRGAPYIFRIKNFSADGQPAVLYSFTDLTFLQSLEGKMLPVFTWLVVIYVFLSFLYYQYLKKQISEPITSMMTIAFEYAQNDFTNRLEVHGNDDLTQLATAMNKMGYSLETKGTAVRQEKDLLSKIVSSIETGVLFFDSDDSLLLSNPKGEVFYNRYQSLEQSFDPENPDTLTKAIAGVKKNHQPVHFTLELKDEFFDLTISALLEEGSDWLRGYVLSSQDMTSEYRLDKMRVDFINNVSHEIRTPLVMVQGYSEAIIDDVAETAEDKKEMALIIRDEAQRMNRMVNEMLNLSRMEAGYMELVKEKVKTITYFKRLLSRFKKMADKAGVQLEVEIETEISFIYVDRDKMDQVFVNLLNNAIRHTGLSGKEQPKVRIWVHLDKLVDQVMIEIIDNGTGIPEDDLPFVFERFYKADKARNKTGKSLIGTGIGLSLVKEIVQAHGGSVEVKSIEGEGANFIIHLPYVELDTIELN